jgi:hypothetical protein
MLVSQDPYSLDLGIGGDDKPVIEFTDVREHRLSSEGTLIQARASRAQRFDGHDVLYDIDVMMSGNTTSTLRSDNATMANETIVLRGNVRYVNNTTTLTTDAARYSKGLIEGLEPFVLQERGLEARGSSFRYNTDSGKLTASDIDAKILTR